MLASPHGWTAPAWGEALDLGGAVDDLVEWLGEQLDEDERIAQAAASVHGPVWWYDPGPDGQVLAGKVLDGGSASVCALAMPTRSDAEGAHAARHDPARVLREIDAKRQLIARGGPFCTSDCDEPGNEPMNPDTNWTTPLEHHFGCGAYEAAKVLAAVYADRPGYREERRP